MPVQAEDIRNILSDPFAQAFNFRRNYGAFEF